ncbi:hypothetical protein CASFOL_039910 [Castilleja foliolosa]|uniref:Peptidase A1 domain-containing protein n=1 Tax=Castilleja foliolosa TaxID=1961234 RepID=A0ABD3BGI4_9LAMI
MPKSTFEVFDMYGPCSPSAAARTSPMKMPSPHDILRLDQLRVKALQARFKSNSTTNKNDSRFQDTKDVAHLLVEFSNSNHAITIGLGTPPQIQTLIFDIGSDITWSNGLNSDSLQIISCDSPSCHFLPQHTCETFKNLENTCFYNIGYGYGPNSKGALIRGILTIQQTGDMFQFLFGCATEVSSQMLMNLNANGVLGLGKDPISFVSQTEDIYNGIFSYCFPSSPSSTGFLKLGPRDYPDNMRFTPLIASLSYPSFYFINIISISVGHVQLSINLLDLRFPGTVIDSGTVVSRLPLNVYITMRNEFHRQMTNYGYQTAQSPHHFFDTCYNDIHEFFIPP